jgi:D-xylose transport system ATP-binding protein
VLDLILRLKEQQLGVVVISHNLADIFAVCDRVVVLRLGRRVATFQIGETTSDELVGAITGSSAAAMLPDVDIGEGPAAEGGPAWA